MRVKEKSESGPDTFGVKGDRRSRDNRLVNKSTTDWSANGYLTVMGAIPHRSVAFLPPTNRKTLPPGASLGPGDCLTAADLRSRKAGRPVLFRVGSGKLMLIDDRARLVCHSSSTAHSWSCPRSRSCLCCV